MADRTKIEWATATWNPITGCSPVSEGCENCYARRMAYRLKGRHGYPMDNPFQVTPHLDRLYQPLHWHKPRHIFVVSMGDLFHPHVSDIFQGDILSVIEHCEWHTFLVLTKRPLEMQKVIQWAFADIPPDNLWLGVTAENQARADERIPILLQIPAAKRFVSLEPMLGLVDISPALPIETIGGVEMEPWLDWVIVGGETGPGARPMHPDWVRSVRDQCQAAQVPFFFKQWGSCPYPPGDITYWINSGYDPYDRHHGGRLLDGREWNERPK